MTKDTLQIWKSAREARMKAEEQRQALYKNACKWPTFLSNKEAQDWLNASKATDWSDKTKNEMDPADTSKVVKYLQSIPAAEVANMGGKEKATRIMIDAIHLPHQILSGTADGNYHVQKLIGKGRIKAVDELITQPHMQQYLIGPTNLVTTYDWDANWTLAFNMIDVGLGNREVKIVNTYLKTNFMQLGWTEGIKFRNLGDDFYDVVKLDRWGDGIILPRDLFNGAAAANLNMVINSLRVGNEEQKANQAYTELLSYTGTTTATTTSIQDKIVAINTGAHLLKNRLRPSDREVARATSSSLLLMYVNDSSIADRMTAALTAQSQAGGSAAIEVVGHNIQMVRTLQVSATPDTSNPGVLLVLPGFQLYAASGMALDIQSNDAWKNNGYEVGAQATWVCDNQNSNQITLVNES